MVVETRQSRNGSATQRGKEGNGSTGSGARNGQEDEKKMNKTFYIIFLSLVIDLLAFTVILPLLPSLLDHYGHNDKVSVSLELWKEATGFSVHCNFPSVFLHDNVDAPINEEMTLQ